MFNFIESVRILPVILGVPPPQKKTQIHCICDFIFQLLQHQQARSVPIIPARSIPHYPMTTSSPAIKITQPIVNVSSDKGLATTGLSPLSLTVKTAQNTVKTTPSLPQTSSNIINNPSGVLSVRNSISNQPGTAKAVTQVLILDRTNAFRTVFWIGQF